MKTQYGRHHQSNFIFSLLICVMSWLTPLSAFASLEIRGTFAQLNAQPQDLNDYEKTLVPNLVAKKQISAVGADLIATLPAMPIGLGVRYESFSYKEAVSGGEADLSWKRVSVLINKRFHDHRFYLGPIASFALSSDVKYTLQPTGAVTSTEVQASDLFSATLGLETGFRLWFLKIGIEAGYMYAPLGAIQNSSGTSIKKSDGSETKFDLSGPYGRASVGFSF